MPHAKTRCFINSAWQTGEMLDKILYEIKKFIPKSAFEFFQPAYHYALAFFGALVYGFPSKKLYVIGVTGTKGKTTTSNLIHHILNSSGQKTGLITTVNIKIGDKEEANKLKQTMLGRFKLQKLLAQMVKEGCAYAVVETSSEGILQFRHKFVDYNAGVFINLSPEHLERHGGFENYRSAKIKLFEKVARKKNGVGIYNLDDENAERFLKPEIKNKWGYGIKNNFQFPMPTGRQAISNFQSILKISDIKLRANGSEFSANGVNYKTNLVGEFNIYNCAAAICAALSQSIATEKIQKSLESFKSVPGRMEVIDSKKGFRIIVDYAHEPKSLEEVYKAARDTQIGESNGKLVCVLGSAGGGRDKWKRPEMGKIAAGYCDEIILTNEDPYDENPNSILDEIEFGFGKMENGKWKMEKNYFKIIDRKEAIKKAISLAKKGDVVVLTGKGGEVWMCVEKGKKIEWNERKIVEEILGELNH